MLEGGFSIYAGWNTVYNRQKSGGHPDQSPDVELGNGIKGKGSKAVFTDYAEWDPIEKEVWQHRVASSGGRWRRLLWWYQ